MTRFLRARRGAMLLGASLAMSLAACTTPSNTTVDESKPAAPVKAERPDPGPQLKRLTGPREARTRDALTATIKGRHSAEGHTWVLAEVPALRGQGNERFFQAEVLGSTHGVAVLDQDAGWLHVRLVGAQAPEKLTVKVRMRSWDTVGGSVVDVVLPGVDKAKEDKLVVEGWRRAMSSWFSQRRSWGWGSSPFHQFASARLEWLAVGGAQAPAAIQEDFRQRRRSDLGEMMSLYTGVVSVEEALQADRGLRQRIPAAGRTVDVAKIEAPPLPAHPWDRMIQEVKGGQTAIEPMAAYVPQDFVYLHFHDLRTFVKLARDLDQWVSPLSVAMEDRPGVTHFTDRIEKQLVVERTMLSENFGHLAADGVAVVSSDPFLREGGDVSLLFMVKNAAMLTGTLETFEKRAQQTHPEMTVSTWEVDGLQVRHLSTPDRAIHQHRVQLDGVLIVSNSREAVKRLVDARRGRVATLENSGDFKYMRTRYPYSSESEDGFLFLSDAFVAHVISPRVKILQSRRMAARADLQAINHAALLYGWLEGRPPKDAAELVASGLLHKDELVHGDGAPITFTPARGATSAAWGRVASLTPLIELPLDKATEAEAQAYADFVTTYQNYWRGFIDPIAVRIRRDDKRLEAEALMLPLIQGTDYNDLRRQVGRRTMAMPPTGIQGGRMALAVGDDAGLRRFADEIAREITGSRDIRIDWLGDWVMVGVGDRSGLWDMALRGGDVPGLDPDSDVDFEALIPRFPLYIGAHIRNKLGLAAALTAIRGFIERAAPGMVSWEAGETYRDHEITEIRERNAVRSRREPISLKYTIVQDVFLASFDRATLEAQMDAVLDADPGASKEALEVQSALVLAPATATGWLNRSLLGMLERTITRNFESAALDYEALARGLGKIPADEAARRQVALDYLGYEPMLAHGGPLEMTDDGLVRHSLYGTLISPSLPEIPLPDAPLTRVVQELESLRMGLSFDGEGDHLGLRVNVDWRRR